MTTPDSPHGTDPRNPELPGDPVLRIDEELSAEELALRRLLHDAVEDIEPRHDALLHLRRAVPARRAHRRQLMVGSAAACLLALVAVPAVLHVANTAASETANPANAASAHDTGSGAWTDNDEDKAEPPVGGSGNEDGADKSSAASDTRPSRIASSSPDPSDTLAATAPLCTSADLGNPVGATGVAGADGRVSGYFRVSNVSSSPCTVNDDSAAVTATPQGGADASRISVVDHTAGDGSGLPDVVSNALILTAGQAYEVEFTWVPAAGGGTTGCETTSTASPTPSASDDSSGGTTVAATATATAGSAPAAGSASILLTHTPEAGSPAVTTTIGDACAGTVYKTGAIAAA